MPTITYEFSGRELLRRRQALGLRAEHLAIATGRSTHAVERWERGLAVPPTSVLLTLCSALDCAPADLLPATAPAECAS
jgi:transcriptional regulator with XRE-family HTH domain